MENSLHKLRAILNSSTFFQKKMISSKKKIISFIKVLANFLNDEIILFGKLN